MIALGRAGVLMLSEAVFVVVELPLALVTPVQPDIIAADNKSDADRKRIKTRGIGRACGWVER